MTAQRRADETTFRAALKRYPTGVAVVTARSGGMDHAMTANSLTSVSLDPLLLLFCVAQEARFAEAVLDAREWGVSLLSRDGRAAANWFATRGRPLVGQLEAHPHSRGPCTGAALLTASVATMECRTVAVHPGGDHLIVVGEVLDVDLSPDDPAALLYLCGGYSSVVPLGATPAR